MVSINSEAPNPNTFFTVRNDSSLPKRLQVTAYRWTQTEPSTPTLTPTDEVVLFPLLLTLEPNQSRQLRLGVTAPPTTTEKTYRVIVEELPSPQTQGSQGMGLNMRLKMSIPVFFQPSQPQGQPGITNLVNNNGKFAFNLTNTGNAHYMAKEIQVTGTDSSGKSVWQKSRQGWYVLANSAIPYGLELPKTDCQKVTNLTVDVKTDNKTNVSQSLPTPQGICPKN
jgi:fimbrial chaperone protein